MSIADVQRSFARGLDGKAACKLATIEIEDGGRAQRLTFHVIGSSGSAYLSESIPSDMCPMQHARHMAQEFLEGRIAGHSRIMTQVLGGDATPRNAAQIASQVIPQAASTITIAAPKAESVAPALTAPESNPTPATADEFDRAIAAGDLEAVKEIICGWIDADAGAIRRVWANDNPGLALEYEQVRREINDLAYGLIPPSPEAFPCLWASVGADVPKTGNDEADLRAAAQIINECIDATNGFLARVRAARLKTKASVRNAANVEAALELYHTVQWPVA